MMFAQDYQPLSSKPVRERKKDGGRFCCIDVCRVWLWPGRMSPLGWIIGQFFCGSLVHQEVMREGDWRLNMFLKTIYKVLLIKKKPHEKCQTVNCETQIEGQIVHECLFVSGRELKESQNAVLLRSFVVLATHKYLKEGSVHWVEWHARVKNSAIKSNGSDN